MITKSVVNIYILSLPSGVEFDLFNESDAAYLTKMKDNAKRYEGIREMAIKKGECTEEALFDQQVDEELKK